MKMYIFCQVRQFLTSYNSVLHDGVVNLQKLELSYNLKCLLDDEKSDEKKTQNTNITNNHGLPSSAHTRKS